MVISELIEKLEGIKSLDGDLQVKILEDVEYPSAKRSIKCVTVEEDKSYDFVLLSGYSSGWDE